MVIKKNTFSNKKHVLINKEQHFLLKMEALNQGKTIEELLCEILQNFLQKGRNNEK